MLHYITSNKEEIIAVVCYFIAVYLVFHFLAKATQRREKN